MGNKNKVIQPDSPKEWRHGIDAIRGLARRQFWGRSELAKQSKRKQSGAKHHLGRREDENGDSVVK